MVTMPHREEPLLIFDEIREVKYLNVLRMNRIFEDEIGVPQGLGLSYHFPIDTWDSLIDNSLKSIFGPLISARTFPCGVHCGV